MRSIRASEPPQLLVDAVESGTIDEKAVNACSEIYPSETYLAALDSTVGGVRDLARSGPGGSAPDIGLDCYRFRRSVEPVSVLPDILAPGLNFVFCGTAVGTASASRGHYYAGRGNKFWEFLYTAGFTPTQLDPDDDASLPQYGVGLTDLVKDVSQSHDRGLDFSRTPDLERRLSAVQPRWVAFTGLRAGGEAARVFGHDKPRHGRQTWRIGESQVFVVTNPSGAANDSRTWDGMPTKVGWWLELKRHIEGRHEQV